MAMQGKDACESDNNGNKTNITDNYSWIKTNGSGNNDNDDTRFIMTVETEIMIKIIKIITW